MTIITNYFKPHFISYYFFVLLQIVWFFYVQVNGVVYDFSIRRANTYLVNRLKKKKKSKKFFLLYHSK